MSYSPLSKKKLKTGPTTVPGPSGDWHCVPYSPVFAARRGSGGRASSSSPPPFPPSCFFFFWVLHERVAPVAGRYRSRCLCGHEEANRVLLETPLTKYRSYYWLGKTTSEQTREFFSPCFSFLALFLEKRNFRFLFETQLKLCPKFTGIPPRVANFVLLKRAMDA